MGNTEKVLVILGCGHGAGTAGKRIPSYLDPYETREWVLSDPSADMIQEMLADYNCTIIRVDDTTGKKDIALLKRVGVANGYNAVIYISLHKNAGVKGKKTGYMGRPAGGTTVFYYPTGDCKEVATRLYNSIIEQTGLVGDRAEPVASGKGYYIIRSTKCPCFIVEDGFMDSPNDVPLLLSDEHKRALARGVVNFLISEYKLVKNGQASVIRPNTTVAPPKNYVYGGVDYSLVFDPIYYSNKYADLKKAFGTNATKLLAHFVVYGIKEGRQAKSTFNVRVYKDSHADLQRAFGNDMKAYVQHYLTYGCKETSRRTV